MARLELTATVTLDELALKVGANGKLYDEMYFPNESPEQSGLCDVLGLVHWLQNFDDKTFYRRSEALAMAVILAFQAAAKLGIDLPHGIVAAHNHPCLIDSENVLPDDLRQLLTGVK
jgi:hypothetical protein